jgi:hypothetical protein
VTFDELLNDPAVRGLCIGSCVDGTAWGDTEKYTEVAHAHTPSTKDRYPGYICVRSWSELFAGRGKNRVSATVLEELAHLRADAGHTGPWRREMRRLGQPIPPHYRKRK